MDQAASRTAMMAALGRALHLNYHGSRALLADWLAWPLVGPDADTILETSRPLIGDVEVPFATWFGARSRLAEDWLAASGANQYVILGAGLDSFAWRQSGNARVFEVDHPFTQEWKRTRASTLNLQTPPGFTWVPVDFERDQLEPALSAAGLDVTQPVFVSWLGVLPYLTEEAITSTLGQLPPCSLAVGYVPPAADQDDDARELGARVEAIARSLGEPWLTLPSPTEFGALVGRSGFAVVEDVGPHDIEARYGLPALNYERMALVRNHP